MSNLSHKLRPTSFDDFVGQQHLRTFFKTIIANNDHSSFVFYGESGTGKTTAAILLAKALYLKYTLFNAANDSKKQLLEAMENSQLIIIDEIHRLRKDVQDVLLQNLENGKIIVYGTTTENPFFKIVPAIRSRLHILQFNKIPVDEAVARLIKISESSLVKVKLDEEQLRMVYESSAGDLRNAIGKIDLLNSMFGDQTITKEVLKKSLPELNFYSDASGDSHYNHLSAFHKSLRGSNVDAALYWGNIILKSGDIDGLFRRLTAVAYEDIGLAQPQAALQVDAAYNAFMRLGMPEGSLPVSHIIAYLALCPKSNSVYSANAQISSIIDSGKIFQAPKHLQDSHYKSASLLGVGNYLYPHDYKHNFIVQQYLPDELKNLRVFRFGENKNEQSLARYWDEIIRSKNN